jgi:hypothetical protein
MLKDGHSQTGLILLCNWSALTVSYIGPQHGLNQEFIAAIKCLQFLLILTSPWPRDRGKGQRSFE